jgi:hypothetical protein
VSDHYEIRCKECNKRIGGCRCMGEPKRIHYEGPCDVCKAVKTLENGPQGTAGGSGA